MLHPISQGLFGLVTMLMLTGTPAFIEAAQAPRTKAQKAPAAKEDPGPCRHSPGGRGARVFGRARRDVYRKGSLRQTAAYCRKQIIVNSRALLAGVSAGRLAA